LNSSHNETAPQSGPIPTVKPLASRIEACLETLNFTEFKEKVKAKVAAKIMPKQSGSDDLDSNVDSIFKTLVGKLKNLEISHSILDLYIGNMHACYSSVIESVRTDHLAVLREKESLVEDLSVRLEQAMSDLNQFTPAGKAMRRQIDRNQEMAEMLWGRAYLSGLAISLCLVSVFISMASFVFAFRLSMAKR